MQILQYPHPTLRRASKPLRRVDAELREMVREMFRLMYEHKGIGLAANQVDLPYRLFITNVTGNPAQAHNEMVFVNPVITRRRGMQEAEEGCLSIPGLYGQVSRPNQVAIEAYDLSGQVICCECQGMMARVVQHENDHLDGVLFIDKLSPTSLAELREELEAFELEFQSRREVGQIPNDGDIVRRLEDLEKQRC
jgi:peptide deformylase